jgi:hypothetical protein
MMVDHLARKTDEWKVELKVVQRVAMLVEQKVERWVELMDLQLVGS